MIFKKNDNAWCFFELLMLNGLCFFCEVGVAFPNAPNKQSTINIQQFLIPLTSCSLRSRWRGKYPSLHWSAQVPAVLPRLMST